MFSFWFWWFERQVKIQILASGISFFIWGWEISFSIKIPSISLVSSRDPPVFPWTLIKSKLTSYLSRLATDKTALTAILARLSLFLLTTFELKDVLAASINLILFSSLISIVSAIVSKVLRAISQAFSNPSAILRGWRPLSIKIPAYSRRAPANTTTPVVPSPISLSWELDNSHNNFAVGCSISILSRIVAPSFVTVTS